MFLFKVRFLMNSCEVKVITILFLLEFNRLWFFSLLTLAYLSVELGEIFNGILKKCGWQVCLTRNTKNWSLIVVSDTRGSKEPLGRWLRAVTTQTGNWRIFLLSYMMFSEKANFRSQPVKRLLWNPVVETFSWFFWGWFEKMKAIMLKFVCILKCIW